MAWLTSHDDAMQRDFAGRFTPHIRNFVLQGVIFMILGAVAVALPQISTLAITILIGWLFVIGGVLRVVLLGQARHLPGWGWAMASAILAVAVGLVIVAAPLEGVLTLTIVLIALFLVEGAGAIAAAIRLRHYTSSWAWLLVSGIVDLVLAGIIWAGWPGTASWAIGLLVGINLFFLGLSFLMIGLTIRRLSAPR